MSESLGGVSAIEAQALDAQAGEREQQSAVRRQQAELLVSSVAVQAEMPAAHPSTTGGIAEFDRAVAERRCPYLNQMGAAALSEYRTGYEQARNADEDELAKIIEQLAANDAKAKAARAAQKAQTEQTKLKSIEKSTVKSLTTEAPTSLITPEGPPQPAQVSSQPNPGVRTGVPETALQADKPPEPVLHAVPAPPQLQPQHHTPETSAPVVLAAPEISKPVTAVPVQVAERVLDVPAVNQSVFERPAPQASSPEQVFPAGQILPDEVRIAASAQAEMVHTHELSGQSFDSTEATTAPEEVTEGMSAEAMPRRPVPAAELVEELLALPAEAPLNVAQDIQLIPMERPGPVPGVLDRRLPAKPASVRRKLEVREIEISGPQSSPEAFEPPEPAFSEQLEAVIATAVRPEQPERAAVAAVLVAKVYELVEQHASKEAGTQVDVSKDAIAIEAAPEAVAELRHVVERLLQTLGVDEPTPEQVQRFVLLVHQELQERQTTPGRVMIDKEERRGDWGLSAAADAFDDALTAWLRQLGTTALRKLAAV